MKPAVIFDLDQTLVDTSFLEGLRNARNWSAVYGKIPLIKTFDFISDCLNFLNAGSVNVIIITTSPRPYCEKIISHFNWPITASICYHDVKPNIKPHPQAFLKAISDYNLDITKVISAGDRDIDVVASRAAKIPVIGCTWASPDKNSLLSAQPTYVANSSLELFTQVKLFHSL